MGYVAKIAESVAPAERRRSPRHRLCLDIELSSAGEAAAPAVIHELSQTGFLIETATEFAPGEDLELQLPDTNTVSARVIWSCDRYFGCEFKRSISSAALSAAMLRARPARAADKLPRKLLLKPAHGGQGVGEHATPNLTRSRLGLILILVAGAWAVLALLFAAL